MNRIVLQHAHSSIFLLTHKVCGLATYPNIILGTIRTTPHMALDMTLFQSATKGEQSKHCRNVAEAALSCVGSCWIDINHQIDINEFLDHALFTFRNDIINLQLRVKMHELTNIIEFILRQRLTNYVSNLIMSGNVILTVDFLL